METSWEPLPLDTVAAVAVALDVWSGNPETDKAWAHDAQVFDAYFPGITY